MSLINGSKSTANESCEICFHSFQLLLYKNKNKTLNEGLISNNVTLYKQHLNGPIYIQKFPTKFINIPFCKIKKFPFFWKDNFTLIIKYIRLYYYVSGFKK